MPYVQQAEKMNTRMALLMALMRAVSQLVYTEAIGLFVVFSQGKPLLAIFVRPQ
jgi:hypothetical protein